MIRVGLSDLADTVAFATVAWAQWRVGSAIVRWSRGWRVWIQKFIRIFLGVVLAWLVIGFCFAYQSVNRLAPVPVWLRGWLSGGSYVLAFTVTGVYLAYALWRWAMARAGVAGFDPGRRKVVNAAGGALAAAPLALVAFGGLVERTAFRVREVDIPIPDLPRDLEGLRILQLSDIHLGAFLEERELERVIGEARNLRPQLTLVTGDLISMSGDPLDACLRQIARLRGEAEMLGCMGNHESYAGVQKYTAEQGARLGIDFLRERARPLRFGAATLNVAGVDYQRIADSSRYLTGAERLILPGALNVLLSHNPDVFPVAAKKGFDFTISGHTHGGQVNVEILDQNLNPARFFTPFVYGRYSLKRPDARMASLYVSRGIGTIGLPVRIGAPPEITLLRLRAA